MQTDYRKYLIIPEQSLLYKQLDKQAATAKAVCFTGLPGVGKSLYVQQFSYMALSKGRKITILQWDITRQGFETKEAVQKYPEINGVTHAGIRKACGWWSRKAVGNWYKQHAQDDEILIIEAPLVGNRLVELALPHDDEVEIFLSSKSVQFMIPIPSEEVRKVIVSKRKETSHKPGHVHEKTDAQPHVMMLLYKELCQVALKMGKNAPGGDTPEYRPEVYENVYREVLKYRHVLPLHIDALMNTGGKSVYEFKANDIKQLAPTLTEANQFIQMVAENFTNLEDVKSSVEKWYLVNEKIQR